MNKRITYVSNPERQDRQGQGGHRMPEESQQVLPGGVFGLSEAEGGDRKRSTPLESQQVSPGDLFGFSSAGESRENYGKFLESQQVCPGELFGVSETERDFSPESHTVKPDAGRGESTEKRLPEEEKVPKKDKKPETDEKSKENGDSKNQVKQSPLAVVREMLLQNHRFIRDELRNVYFYEGGIYQKADGILLAEFIKRNVVNIYVWQISDPNFYNRLLTDLKSDYRIKMVNRKKLDNREKYLVAFQNGVYDCRQESFVSFSPDFYLFSKLEVRYRENADAVIFHGFLNEVSGGDVAVKRLIWEMIAYILMPTNDGKCFFVMGTAPNSGKSLLAKVVEAMFPDSVVNRSPISAISGRFGLASMADKRINIAPECVEERISAEVVNNIKLLTGEESVNVERKGIDASREYISCKLLIATNCATAFAVKDLAFWNRMRIVPFLYSVPQQDQRSDLFEDLKRELDAIASIAVSEFARPLIESNYQFTVPDASARLMSQWRNSSLDLLREFLDCKCEITNDPSDFIAVSKLYDEYLRWLKSSQSYAEPFAINDFSRKIRERFTQCKEPRIKERVGGEYVRVLHGICWLETFDTE